MRAQAHLEERKKRGRSHVNVLFTIACFCVTLKLKLEGLSYFEVADNDLSDCRAVYKKQQSYKTNWARSHFVACPPGFAFLLFLSWLLSLHVGVHSAALTSLLGHELNYLWDMNRTWPRAQITEREEERP